MRDYIIVTDCTCDLSMDIIDKYDIKVIPMEFTLDNEVHLHTHDFKAFHEVDFFNKLRNGSVASTTQITPFTYNEYLTPFLEQGKDILYIAFSSGLSNTYQSSCLAFEELKQKFPEAKIVTIDSLAASAGEGLMTLYACLNKENGMTIEENEAWIREHIQQFVQWFTVDDLHFLKRGGRVSATTAIVGSALKIKPILHVDESGHLINIAKTHGRNKSLSTLANKLEELIEDAPNQIVMISHGDCIDDAELLKQKILDKVAVKDVIISEIGPVVGAHSGPGTVALFFFGTSR